MEGINIFLIDIIKNLERVNKDNMRLDGVVRELHESVLYGEYIVEGKFAERYFQIATFPHYIGQKIAELLAVNYEYCDTSTLKPVSDLDINDETN